MKVTVPLSSARLRRGTPPAGWAAVAALVVATTTACSTTTSSEPGAATGADSIVPDFAAILKEGYVGAFSPPTAQGPAAVPDKDVWAISCGQAAAACALLTSEFQEAGAELGWNVTVVDGKTDPAVTSNAINQAVAANADGIVNLGMDCSNIISALQNAKDAGIPVITRTSFDCDQGGGEGEALFAAQLNDDGRTDPGEILSDYGAARARFLAARLGGEGTILSLEETSYLGSKAANEGFHAELDRVCPDCEVVRVPWTFSQLGTSAKQTWQSAILKNADADALAVIYDSLMPSGLQDVLKQTGFRGLVAGAEGLNLDLMRSGVQTPPCRSFTPCSPGGSQTL